MYDPTKDARLTKLPRWAQDEVKRLAANVEFYRKQAFQACSVEAKGTDTFIDNYDDSEVRGLPRGTSVSFRVKDTLIRVRVEDGVLDVNASCDMILVRPWACNKVTIERP